MDLVWIVDANYLEHFKVYLKFNDGIDGIIDFKDRLNDPVFVPLNNIEVFKNFKLNDWTIEWPNGADFAPEFLYKELMKAKSNMDFA